MAAKSTEKLYENVTDTLQVVYDLGGGKYEIVPGGTVFGDEKDFAKYGCLREKKVEESK